MRSLICRIGGYVELEVICWAGLHNRGVVCWGKLVLICRTGMDMLIVGGHMLGGAP
jgi:hypothetical protein